MNYYNEISQGYEELYKEEQIKNKKSLFYICGPSLFVKDIMNSLGELGVNKESIKTERYGDGF